MIKNKVIVFALEHYNPLGLVRSLGENGVRPIYIAVETKKHFFVTDKSKYILKTHYVKSVEEGFNLLLNCYGNESMKPYILFSDDKSVSFFDLHYEEVKDKFVFFNAQTPGRICEFMNKKRILDLAKEVGLNVLKTIVVNKGDIPDDLEYPIITKGITPIEGNWKGDVYICNNRTELEIAYGKIASSTVLLQKYVDKKNEYALQGFTVNKGNEMLIATAMTWKYLIKGYYSPYHDVTMFQNKEMETKLLSMFSKIGFEGIFEVEFIIDQDDTFYFSEINFRASAWNYTGSCAGMPLSYLWVKSMVNGHIEKDDYKSFENFTSLSEPIDFGLRVDTGKISLAEWLKAFKEAKCTYYYNKDDIAPFEMLYQYWDRLK